MTKEEHRKYRREYMRKYNSTEKGKLYNRSHSKIWRKKTKTPRSKYRKGISQGYRDMIIDFLVKRDGLICGICSGSLENSDVHIDHKIPVALGGKDVLENVQLAHPPCNLKNSNKIRKQKYGY